MTFGALIWALAATVAVLFCVSLLVGPAGLGVSDSVTALLSGRSDATAIVMREIRLPRAILAVLLGVSLGMAGAAMQGFLRFGALRGAKGNTGTHG